MTNADKIRQMTEEELVEFFGTNAVCNGKLCEDDADDCRECCEKWLKQEVENEE